MIIEVDTYENIEQGAAEALGMTVECLRAEIQTMTWEALQSDGFYDWDTVHRWSVNFIHNHRGEDITAVYVCHLARLIEIPGVLLPLATLLTSNNSFTAFLSENGIQFSFFDNRLILEYNGEVINPERIYDPGAVEHEYSGLAFRLGYLEGEQDFCVNGFGFAAGIENDLNGYYKSLVRGPEVLMRLDDFLGTDLRKRYVEKSTYYIIYIRAEWGSIVFDGRETLNAEEKREYFLEKCIEHLMQYYETGSGIRDIPVIRFADTDCVQVDHFQEIAETEFA